MASVSHRSLRRKPEPESDHASSERFGHAAEGHGADGLRLIGGSHDRKRNHESRVTR